MKEMWLEFSKVRKTITQSWNMPTSTSDVVDNQPRKMRRLCKVLQNWKSRTFGNVRCKKKEINKEILSLELCEEVISIRI